MSKLAKGMWQTSHIESVKKKVKESLEEAMLKGGISARLQKIFETIRSLENSQSSEDHLTLVIYIISALVHHERYQGLGKSQIEHLMSLAHNILRLREVTPETSRGSVFYGELHLALSQIHRKSGRHWAASWEQHVAHHLSRRNPPGGISFQSLALGLRSQRMGHMVRAERELANAEQGNLDHEQFNQARIARIRTLRLSGRLSEARALAEGTIVGSSSDRLIREAEWEKICIECSSSQDLGPMMKSVRKNQPHYFAAFLVESYFWAHCYFDNRWIIQLPKMQTVARNSNLEARALGLFFDLALKMDEICDEEIPFVLRLKTLGFILEQARDLTAIDRELLIYLSAARWLAQQRSYKLAATCLWEYRGMSFKISDGTSSDILGLGKDLFEKSWFSSV